MTNLTHAHVNEIGIPAILELSVARLADTLCHRVSPWMQLLTIMILTLTYNIKVSCVNCLGGLIHRVLGEFSREFGVKAGSKGK